MKYGILQQIQSFNAGMRLIYVYKYKYMHNYIYIYTHTFFKLYKWDGVGNKRPPKNFMVYNVKTLPRTLYLKSLIR